MVPKTLIQQQGFSLVELLIVVVIIGILGAIGLPSYQSHMEKSRRSEATVTLTELASLQERYYLENSEYTDDLADLGFSGTQSKPDGHYQVSIEKTDANTFTITATPEASGLQASDTDCASITLDSNGTRLPLSCW